MNVYRRLVWPMLQQLDPEWAHARTLQALELAQRTYSGRLTLRQIRGAVPAEPVQVWGLTFPNVLGVAAGFDKDARVPRALGELGFGYIEVGTLTPRPQSGNPRPRLFRLPEDGAVINRLGFPNGGAEAAARRLERLSRVPRAYRIGVSLGKQKETPLAEAGQDYAAVMRAVYPWADYLAVNVSSPNTPGLRELQGAAYLRALLGGLSAESRTLAQQHNLPRRPLLLKIAPDLTWPEVDAILQVALDSGSDGIIAANTSVARPNLTNPQRTESGGLSGRPLRRRSHELIAYIHRQTQGQLPIIGVGGVSTADDVQMRLDAGASLVQLYTAMIYDGPALAGHILRGLVGRQRAAALHVYSES